VRFSADTLEMLYGRPNVAAQSCRYEGLAARFAKIFPGHDGARFFSAPGRAEIGGNHTDHQSGRVLCAAIDLDTVAAAAPNGGVIARVESEGFPPVSVDLSDLSPRNEERGTSAAVVRGCAARLRALGFATGGFDAVVTSNVFSGSGLSSSAAFEMMVCAVFDGLFGGGGLTPVIAAQVSQYAENHYFGKPCGLLDQMASAMGGVTAIDFRGAEPEVKRVPYDFAAEGYALAVVNTGGSHDDLTEAYAAITREMGQVAAHFGEKRLRPVDPGRFEAEIPVLRKKLSERVILRALHFFDENERVLHQVAALKAGDLPRFFSLIIESGDSSWKLLQNVWASPAEQPLALALALSARMLRGHGAWRVHGGGFAGTILAFVPLDMLDTYKSRMNSVFGEGACHPLRVRPVGAYEVEARGAAE